MIFRYFRKFFGTLPRRRSSSTPSSDLSHAGRAEASKKAEISQGRAESQYVCLESLSFDIPLNMGAAAISQQGSSMEFTSRWLVIKIQSFGGAKFEICAANFNLDCR